MAYVRRVAMKVEKGSVLELKCRQCQGDGLTWHWGLSSRAVRRKELLSEMEKKLRF